MKHAFDTTDWTLIVEAAKSQSAEGRTALEALCRAYWPPMFGYALSCGLSHADAQDMTQGFFHRLLETQMHAQADPVRGRFRSFLMAGMKHYMINQHRNATVEKRGGKNAQWLPLDENRHEADAVLGSPASPEKLYDRQFAYALMAQALEHLREEHVAAGAQTRFEALRPLLFESGYGDQQTQGLAAQLGTTDSAARTALSRFRQRYAELVRREVTRLVDDPAEADAEIAHLMQALRE